LSEEKMNTESIPIEFNNEFNEIKQSENDLYTLASERLNLLAGDHNDISGGVVNFKQPAQGRQTPYIYEVTIVLYMMGSEQIAATEKGEHIDATLDGALDAVEHQVRKIRTQERGY
jgi:ribosome-associated translation inhibitor RaiA